MQKDDVIYRQAAIDALGEEPEVWSGKDEYEQGLNNQWHYDVNAIKAVPSAQPERKKGEWISGAENFNTNYSHECSQCGALIDMYHGGADDYFFCPNCGADMRGDSDADVKH